MTSLLPSLRPGLAFWLQPKILSGDSKMFSGDGYSYNFVQGDKNNESLTLSGHHKHYVDKALIQRSGDTGLRIKEHLVKTMHLVKLHIASISKQGGTFG